MEFEPRPPSKATGNCPRAQAFVPGHTYPPAYPLVSRTCYRSVYRPAIRVSDGDGLGGVGMWRGTWVVLNEMVRRLGGKRNAEDVGLSVGSSRLEEGRIRDGLGEGMVWDTYVVPVLHAFIWVNDGVGGRALKTDLSLGTRIEAGEREGGRVYWAGVAVLGIAYMPGIDPPSATGRRR
ncbi:hypothetical protein FA13DRAFT_329238 [Coprinellus micaceus]|uniref:Uncharacterized protein n=1 Tax=Coprinellus micaceus TaxID=71717 RepID=A0A4Y7SDC6_COPMI|nr:hypothetical protein FA13DRAFT_329238 [Coprinellus micaceus]